MSKQPPRRKAKAPGEVFGRYDKMYTVEAPKDLKNGFFFDIQTMLFGVVIDGHCTGIDLAPEEAEQLVRGAMLHAETDGLLSAPPAGSA